MHRDFFQHLLRNQKKYFSLLLVLVLSAPFLFRFFDHRFLFAGEEAYYLLNLLTRGWNIPEIHLSWLWILSPILGFITALLLWILAKRFTLMREEKFFFLLFLFSSPAFVATFTMLSFPALFAFLVILGCFLLFRKEKKWQYLSLFPFALASTIQMLSALFLLFTAALLFFHFKKKHSIFLLLAGMSFISLVLQFFLHAPLFRWQLIPTHALQQSIADLGSSGGVSIFLLLMAGTGMILLVREKMSIQYMFLGLLLAHTFISPSKSFLLTLSLAFFAAKGMSFLLQRRWNIHFLKGFCFLVILLGLLLSLLTTLPRISLLQPTIEEGEALHWIRENTPPEAIIFSSSDQSYFVSYFAQRKPFFFPHQQDELKKNATNTLFSSTYTHISFPLLKKHNISFLFITPELKRSLPAEQGLLFLLKNEKFILRYSQQGYEVWEFQDTFI